MSKARRVFVLLLIAIPLLWLVRCKETPSVPEASIARPEEPKEVQS